MAGHGEAFERDARDFDRLATAHQMLGRVRAAGHADRREFRVALEPLALAFGHPDLGAGSLREVGDAADVVEVPVRDEDPRARRAEPRELEAKVGRVPPGSMTTALGRAAVAADDVAVRVEGAELVPVDREWHGGESSAALVSRSPGAGKLRPCATGSFQRSRHRTVRASPVVLHSQEGAERAVLIELRAGEALGDHGVKESALLLVLARQRCVSRRPSSRWTVTPARSFTSIPTSGGR